MNITHRLSDKHKRVIITLTLFFVIALLAIGVLLFTDGQTQPEPTTHKAKSGTVPIRVESPTQLQQLFQGPYSPQSPNTPLQTTEEVNQSNQNLQNAGGNLQ